MCIKYDIFIHMFDNLRINPIFLQVASIIFLFLVLFSVPVYTIIPMVIVFGQAHFIIAYIYSAIVKKINSSYALKWMLYVILFGTLAMLSLAYSSSSNINTLAVWIDFTLFIFVIHYTLDEFKLNGFDAEMKHRYLAGLGVAFAFLGVIVTKLWNFPPNIYSVSTLIPAIILIALFFKINSPKKFLGTQSGIAVILFIALNLIIPTLTLLTPSITIYHISGFIVIYHYIRWYIFYFNRFSSNKAYLEYYLDIILWVHFLIFILYFQYRLAPFAGFLFYFFHPAYFYAWTMVHICLAIRKEDYK